MWLKLTLYLRNVPPWYLRIQAAADVVVGFWPFQLKQIQEQGLQGVRRVGLAADKKLAARCRNANSVLLKMMVLQGKGETYFLHPCSSASSSVHSFNVILVMLE